MLPHLEAAGIAINDFAVLETDPSGPLALYPSAQACEAWSAFVFRESCRRTLLVIFQLVALCRLLCGQKGDCSTYCRIGNRVSFSALLWKAKSAFDFAVVWNEKPHHLVKELDFTDLLKTVRPEEIDTFGRMMLAGVMGIDDVKGWFYTRNGSF